MCYSITGYDSQRQFWMSDDFRRMMTNEPTHHAYLGCAGNQIRIA
jgi:hypothetical protein